MRRYVLATFIRRRCLFLLLITILAIFIPCLRAMNPSHTNRAQFTFDKAMEREHADVHGDNGKKPASPSVARNRIVVRFRPGVQKTNEASLNTLMEEYRVSSMKPVFDNRRLVSMKGGKRLLDTYYVEYASPAPPEDVARTFSTNPNVKYSEPVFRHELFNSPNDSLYHTMPQFGIVGAAEAWDRVRGEDADVVIAIVDGGTDYYHADLEANVWINADEIPNNGLDDDDNGFIDDVHGWNFANNSPEPYGMSTHPHNEIHGTHVAGIACGVTNNLIGVSSISWNCRFMPVNASDPEYDGFIVFGNEGIVYAVTNGARIINLSWGRVGEYSELEKDIIDFAYANNVVVVAAAGNGGIDGIGDLNDWIPCYPANYRQVLSVGATDYHDVKAMFSNYGVTVDVFAPGVDIMSTYLPNPPDMRYGLLSGTSMATPFVAGVAGLVRTLYPDWSGVQTREQIRLSCDAIDDVNPQYGGFLGRGRVNAHQTLTPQEMPAVRITGVLFEDSGLDGEINPGDTVDVRVSITNYLNDASNVALSITNNDPSVYLIKTSDMVPNLFNGDTLDVTFKFGITHFFGGDRNLKFAVDILSHDYTDRDFFMLTAISKQFANHDSGALRTSITNQGNIGFVGYSGTEGVGFEYKGTNLLYEGGLVCGMDSVHVSDCIRGMMTMFQDDDFAPASYELLSITSPGKFADEEGYVILNDSLAMFPMDIEIVQESFCFKENDLDEFIIFKYTIENTGSSPLSNFYTGLFIDWDVFDYENNSARFDPTRQMGYIQDKTVQPTVFAATKVLTSTEISCRIVDNPSEIYTGFSDYKKWSFLSGGIQRTALDSTDVSIIASTGPFEIEVGQCIEVAFALIAGSSLSGLEMNADVAQMLWDNGLVHTTIDSDPNISFKPFSLYQNFPNPFNSKTAITYSIPQRDKIHLRVFNLTGQEVRVLVDEEKDAGEYTVHWNGLDGKGNALSSGFYFYSIEIGDSVVETRRMLLLK